MLNCKLITSINVKNNNQKLFGVTNFFALSSLKNLWQIKPLITRFKLIVFRPFGVAKVCQSNRTPKYRR
ncbi:hypothetical protein Cabys_425 [Caldithrix abyssi DSM 13497]|uniref:Uncharacterized protein n=1 Tax=Caldithrix abyssi DSM 13497 TaxID=880073 RepID=A0A1J1C5L0_CALAY|nr:hypothetical protein Cabys_425 [Caldithrix abyssi DSM 13497]